MNANLGPLVAAIIFYALLEVPLMHSNRPSAVMLVLPLLRSSSSLAKPPFLAPVEISGE